MSALPMDYAEFLRSKVQLAPKHGFDVSIDSINPVLKPHQKLAVQWAVKGGRRALFESFGLGKTVQELEWLRLTLACAYADGEIEVPGRGLVVAPLGVRQEFKRDAEMLGLSIKFVRRDTEIDGPGLYITNYESIRDERLSPRHFDAVALDEASCLRGFGGTKTFRQFMALLAGDSKTLDTRERSAGVKYRLVATATPSPNDYIELLAYSAFLDVMDVSAAKTRFFKRNSEKADQLTIHPHKQEEFWLWMASWALFVHKPSDLGCDDAGYELPPIDVRWHEVPTDHSTAGEERDGQMRMFTNAAISIQDTAREKRRSMSARIERMLAIRAEDPDAHRIIWHDLEDERRAIEAAVPTARSVYGSQDLDEREQTIVDFSDGRFAELAAKPSIAGSGCNFQRHCAWAVFLGIGFKFNDFIQAVHRLQRFLQTREVRIDLIYTEAEREVRRELERKWNQHNEMVARMTQIIRKYGLSHAAMAQHLTRAMGVERVEVSGDGYRLVNNDCVEETRRMEDNSADLILTSIPFSTQYEYSPNYADFGHTDNNAQFWQQMDYLVPELLRVLKPGRMAAIHVKDRIVPGGMTGLGFQTVYPFHMDTERCFTRHGFGYMGMKTIVTDVVRENNQTYRLGWTEQCKDGSKMGCGMPEYLMLFRKPPTDTSNGYADDPVAKDKGRYTRSRWQTDAHGFARSSGDRLMTPEEMRDQPHHVIFQQFKKYGLSSVYDFDYHVAIGDALEAQGKLPVTFMLLQPPSWHPDVWTDITRMLSLNSAQSAKGKEMHLCPMQFDIADRVIEQLSMPGETVFDPFGGLMTVPYRAVRLKRRGVGVELSKPYFLDGCAYVEQAAREAAMPSLFDSIDMVGEAAAAGAA